MMAGSTCSNHRPDTLMQDHIRQIEEPSCDARPDHTSGSLAAGRCAEYLVRFALQSRPGWLVGNRLLRADSVAKVPDGWLASNNRIETSTFSNQHCLEATDLESMLRARAPKIVLQHYLPLADIGSPTGPRIFRSAGLPPLSLWTEHREAYTWPAPDPSAGADGRVKFISPLIN
jgi:hypothetical protein